MDFIKEDGSLIRITEDRLEGYLSDGTLLFSFESYNPLRPIDDRFAIGEYEFYTLPGTTVAIRKATKERDKQ